VDSGARSKVGVSGEEEAKMLAAIYLVHQEKGCNG
jgi:hypothetical protein